MHALCLNEKVPAVLTGRTTGIEEGAIKGLLHDLDGAAQVAHGDGVLAGLIDGDVQLTVTISAADVSADAIVLSVIVNIIVIARSRDSFLMSLPPFCKWGVMPFAHQHTPLLLPGRMEIPHRASEFSKQRAASGKTRSEKPKIRQNQTACLIDVSYSYSASVTVPQRLGLVLIFWLPVHASCGIYSVPGQG